MSFFTFMQTNSGGVYQGPAYCVIIEADDADEANKLAKSNADLYFDGCDAGIDCDCCGDRWYEVDGEGDPEPKLYYESVVNHIINPQTRRFFSYDGNVYIQIHFKNGRIKNYYTEMIKGKKKIYGARTQKSPKKRA